MSKKFIGDRIREIRGTRSQREIAEIFGITKASWSNYENGKHEIPVSTMAELCQRFGYSADWILGLSDKKMSESMTPHEFCPNCREKDAVIREQSKTIAQQAETLNNFAKKVVIAPISGIVQSQDAG